MKAKKFSRKLLALFLAVLMAMSCFAGAISATAATASYSTKYHDRDLDFNSLGWPILNDEQACTALLDFVDLMLADANIAPINVDLSILGSITIKLGSVDEILKSVQDLDSFIDGKSGIIWMAGTAQYVRLDALNGMSRSKTSSTDIVRGLVKLVRNLSSDAGTKGANGNIVKTLLRGDFSLGVANGAFNVYKIIGDALGMADGYQSNMVYNIVQQLVLENTGWFTAEEKAQIRKNPNLETNKLDAILLDKLSTQLLSNITAQITYADGSNSADRYKQHLANPSANVPYYFSNLNYVSEEDSLVNGQGVGNIYLFRYNGETLSVKPSDNLYTVAYKAFDMAWHTALKDTLGQLNSNTGGYDYNYFMWYTGATTHNTAWNYSNVAGNYGDADVKAWAAYECQKAAKDLKPGQTLADQYKDAATFLTFVKDDLEKYNDREIVKDPTYTWRDIDSTYLFNKLRYSALSEHYFKQATGPLNCSFAETGMPNLTAFMDNEYHNYSSLPAALNDFLVAAVKDFVPGFDASKLNKTGSEDAATIASTLVGNMFQVLQHIADATDKNILSAFYRENGAGAALTEANIESAMIPFAISALRNIPDFKKGIHNEDLDACDDAEGVAALALQLYLSYVLPEKDYSSLMTKGADGKYDITMNTLLLMARDAVGYVMSPYVVMHDKDGNLWSPETATLNDGVSLFDLLNSVVVYYAGTDTFKDGEQGKGLANLLGVCDTNGNCLVKLSNSLWDNINVIANKLLPVAGVLQYGDTSKKGQLDSNELIYKDVIEGMLNIGTANAAGQYGATGFVTRLMTMVSSAPIKTNGVVRTVYDLLADLVNVVFGGRYGTARNVVPAAATNDHPFDDLLQKDTFAGTSVKTSYGVIGTLVYNLYEATGGVGGDSGKKDTVLPGAMYTVQAVNSLIGGLISTLADHSMKQASIRVQDGNVTLFNSQSTTKLAVTNNCYGLNRAVKNAEGNFVARGRYNIEVTNVVADNAAATVNFTKQTVKPEQAAKFDVTVKGITKDTVITYTATYNIIDTNTKQAVYNDLTCKTYQFLTTDKSWADSVYPGGGLDGNFNQAKNTTTSDGKQNLKVSGRFGAKYLTTTPLDVTYPEKMIVSTSDLGAISDYKLRLLNHTKQDRTMDGAYSYTDATVKDAVTNQNVTVNRSNAIALCDPITGDVLNYEKVDYTTDGGQTWVKGVKANQVPASGVTRVNHAYTLQELKAGNGLKAAVKDGNGYYTAVYLNSGNGNFTYSQLLQNVSCASGINGFYIQTSPIETNDSAVAFTALKYDGKTDIPAIEKQTVKLAFYTGASIAGANIDVTVADTGDMSQFNSAYSALSNYVKNYRPSDFKDYDEANGTSATYDVATAALAAGYQAKYSPLNQSTASTLASNFTKVPVTTEVASAHGEVATVPVQDAAELPENLRATAVTDWSLYYADEDMTKVYYTNVPLTDDDVTIGDDPNSGTENYQNLEVVKVDGTWYYKNSQAYATAWNTDSYDAPYAVDGAAKQGTYNQMKFDHFNDNGVLTSGDYTVKVLLTQKTIVNDGSENRALAMQARDKMRYAVDQCAQMLSVTVAGQIFTKVSTVRDGMTDANFNLPEYQKMVSVAKDAEGMYAADIYLKSDESKTVLATCGWNQIDQTIADLASKNGNDAADYTYAFSTSTSSLQIEEAIRMFNLYMGTVTERGYIGDKVEAEVSHASGSAYSAMTTTWTDSGKVDADGNAIKNAAIATTATSAKYGAVEGGKLVNKGEKVYTDESWTNYVNALAAAVDVATTGNGDYAHKDAATYVPADKDNYTANLSACFTAYKNLVDAENSLEETKPALGHTHNYGAPVADYTSGEAFVEGKDYTHTATCTGEGTCSQPTKTDKCTFDNGVETKAATCTEDGVKTFTCTECGGTYTVAIPATGHAWGQWSHDAATAEADATHTRVCANDASHKETKACDFTAKVTQEATLDQAEITTYTCKDCGYSYTKETAPALAGVTVTVNAVENGSVTLAGQDVTAGGSKKFAENGTYTLVATPNENCTFVGWQTGNKIVSTDATYTTVAIADVTYTPVFAESAKPVQFTFVDMFNNVISSQSVASGADVKIPQAPTYTGYTFTGWSADEATIKAATSSMTVYAQYEKDAAATYTVTTDADATVAYGSNSAQGTLADVPYGTQVTVSKAGATAWAIDGKIVAYGDSYTFYVASDVTVKAASATTQAPVVAAVSANQVAGSYKVEFVATRAMVDGCTYLKSGFVYGKNLTDADLTLANVGKKGSADNSGVVKAAYANSTEGSTQFILSYGISAQTGTASAKAFLTYKDQKGKVQTVYSDVMNHTYA